MYSSSKSSTSPANSTAQRGKQKRAVVIMPGLGNAKNDYKALAELLMKEGLTAEIASVNRIDWLRNAAGVVDINYWKGTLNPQPTVNWYLSRSKLSKPPASALHCVSASMLMIHNGKAHNNNAVLHHCENVLSLPKMAQHTQPSQLSHGFTLSASLQRQSGFLA